MIHRFFSSCLCCLAACGMMTATALLAAENQEVAVYKVGKATVWSITDSGGPGDMAVFPDADAEILKKYAPQGHLPSAIMVFAVQIGDQFILIDTGLGNMEPGSRASMLMNGLGRIGLAPEKVNLILLTHMHGDHIGGLMRDGKKVFPNAKVLCNRLEHDFWLRDQSVLEFPKNQANFTMAKQIMALYSDATTLFDFGDTVAPGVKALDARGHTPGHTAFLLESEDKKLLFWGDLLHAAGLQFPHPEINATYDMNPPVAAATRVRFMEMAARERLPVAGAHLPFPAIGQVKKTGPASYGYSPVF